MSDEALNAHLDWLDKAQEQGEDYETWLEGRVVLLEAENNALSELLSPLVDVELERDVAMSENQRLTKIVEDYEEENAALKRENEAFGDFANTIAYTSDGKRRSSLGLTFTKALEDLKNALLKEQE